MSEPSVSQAAGVRSAAGLPWYLNPYLHLALNAVLVATGQLLMKVAADATAEVPVPRWLGAFGVTALGSWWLWAGVAFHILGFVNWLWVLRFIPVGVAFALASFAQVLVPLGAWALLHETISVARWTGIGLIIVGIGLIADTLGRAEEEL